MNNTQDNLDSESVCSISHPVTHSPSVEAETTALHDPTPNEWVSRGQEVGRGVPGPIWPSPADRQGRGFLQTSQGALPNGAAFSSEDHL